jgi:hypothetical protein
MELNKLVEQFLASPTKSESEVRNYLQFVHDSGFNKGISAAHSLVEECSVPDSYSQPCVDELANEIAALKRNI